jgi:serine/threonine protein kinase
MTDTTCFSRDELRSYLLGELPEPASGEVAMHVETCQSCEATVSELDRESDTLIESLRQPVAAEEPASDYRLAAKRSLAYWQEAVAGASDPVTGQPAIDGIRLRDYELFEPLARGGMGTVYRARHLRLNRQVALKVLPGRLLKDPVVVARFEREMQAVGSLRHPAIVQATDGGEAEGVHFLVMELIDGCDANALIQLLGPLPVADACEIVRRAAIGMAYVHEQGTIHRDLKPSNLMVTRTGEVKVLDLGLARVVGEQLAEDELTTIGQLMGTLDYMAPEQIENSHAVDERTDVYSLGATLYKLLAGRTPHTSEARCFRSSCNRARMANPKWLELSWTSGSRNHR